MGVKRRSRCLGGQTELPLPERRRLLQWLMLAAAGKRSASARALRARSAAPARVVIVGAGFAGSACALHLRRLDPGIDVSLIDPEEHYATCPMSNAVIAGLRASATISVSRDGARRAGVNVVRARVAGIDFGRRCVRLEAGDRLDFDRLVVAPGIRFRVDQLQGYDPAAMESMPHAWQAGAQTLRLAAQLRAMRNGGVVAISVPAGLMRCPPAPYERASLIAHYLSRHKPRSKVLIFDSNNHFPRQDLFTAAWRQLYPGMIEWIAPTEDGAIVRVDAASMTLYTSNGSHSVAVANIIPPQAPGQLAADSGLAADHGWCPIEPLSFESTLRPGVHVIGDACIADAMPKAASAACSQARQCARAIAALLAGDEVPAPSFGSVCYVALAPHRALAINADYVAQHGQIVLAESPVGAGAADSAAPAFDALQVDAAEQWYRRVRAEAFAG